MRCEKQRTIYAGVAELADALDLGSSVSDMQVRPLSPAPKTASIFACRFYLIKFCSRPSRNASILDKTVLKHLVLDSNEPQAI